MTAAAYVKIVAVEVEMPKNAANRSSHLFNVPNIDARCAR